MSTFKIYPVYLGYSSFSYGDMMCKSPKRNESYYVTMGCLLLQNNQTGAWTLLDTGMPSKQEFETEGFPYAYQDDPNAPDGLVEALAKLGVKPTDISQAACSHLHSDHCWNFDLLRRDIPIYVQEEELAHAAAARKPERWSYQLLDLPNFPAWGRRLSQIVCHSGDYEIEPGLKAISTPGHTYGSQSFLIDTEEGKYIYVGDLYYDKTNWENDNMIGWYCSINKWYQSHEKVQQIVKETDAKILSIHYPPTFDHVCYG